MQRYCEEVRQIESTVMSKFRCDECEAIHQAVDLLVAPNPFDSQDVISGCPDCKSVGQFTEICDEPECKREAGCGFPTENGYRRTCYQHSDFKKNQKKRSYEQLSNT